MGGGAGEGDRPGVEDDDCGATPHRLAQGDGEERRLIHRIDPGENQAVAAADFAEAAHPAFRARGMDPNDCFSDAFRLTPHLARTTPAEEVVKLGGA